MLLQCVRCWFRRPAIYFFSPSAPFFPAVSDLIANAQLELACRVGALDDMLEALEEGADVNCKGGSPLFLAIMAGERTVVEALVDRGADSSMFLSPAQASDDVPIADRVDALMACGPGTSAKTDNGGDASSNTDGDEPEIDPKLIGTLDRMIRRKGLTEPFVKKRADELPVFRKALGGIGAEDCHAVVSEFLDALEEARAQAGSSADSEEAVADSGSDGDRETETFDDSIFLESEAERISEWSTRYASTEEAPAALAREYLKERKKLEAGS